MKTVKPVKPQAPVASTNPEPAVRILKTATCPSLSGRSKLSYQIVSVANGTGKSEIQLRVCANTGSGFFSDEPVPLNDIQQAIDKVPSGKPLTSFSLSQVYPGKSANSPGFLFAALVHEGLVHASKEKARCYERGDLKGFMAGIKALTDLTADTKARQPRTEDRPAPTASPKKTPAKASAKKKA